MTPRISLMAYEDRNPWFIFVAIPNERGRYVRTDKSVALAGCPVCGASAGEPCLRRGVPGSASAVYGAGTHAARRDRVSRFAPAPEDIVVLSDEVRPPLPDEYMEMNS